MCTITHPTALDRPFLCHSAVAVRLSHRDQLVLLIHVAIHSPVRPNFNNSIQLTAAGILTFLFFSFSAAQLGQGTGDDSHLFGKRQAIIRRSARNGTVLGPIDPKSNISPHISHFNLTTHFIEFIF